MQWDGKANRRTVLAGLAAVVGTPALGKETSPIAYGALAANPLAQAFEPVPRYSEPPDVTLLSLKGDREFSDYAGKTLLVPLWAEWCAPCLSELGDFALLQRTYGNDQFAVLPILSGTRKEIDPETLAKIYDSSNMGGFTPLIEARHGDRLLRTLGATSGGRYAIPCNVLIAPSGAVVAREIGKAIRGSLPGTGAPDPVDPSKKNDAFAVRSLWSSVFGKEFAAAMANGFLSNWKA